MTAGDFFGEIGALTGSTRTADVVADVDTTLLEVPADALRATMVRAGDPADRHVDHVQPAPAHGRGRPAAAGRRRPGRAARPADAAAQRGVVPKPATRRPGRLTPVRRSGTGGGPHRVDADDDRRARIERQLVADLAGAQQFAEQAALALRQADEDPVAIDVDRRHVVVATIDGEPPTELVHRHVRPALDEPAELRRRRLIDGRRLAGRSGPGGSAGPGRPSTGVGPDRARRGCGRSPIAAAAPAGPRAGRTGRVGRCRRDGGGRGRPRRWLVISAGRPAAAGWRRTTGPGAAWPVERSTAASSARPVRGGAAVPGAGGRAGGTAVMSATHVADVPARRGPDPGDDA